MGPTPISWVNDYIPIWWRAVGRGAEPGFEEQRALSDAGETRGPTG
jgi:hypothetical protein